MRDGHAVNEEHDATVKQLLVLLAGGEAHADFAAALEGLPVDQRGARPERVPYSAWQLVEHLRLAQRDILQFCTNAEGAGYQAKQWPEDYWPQESAPPNAAAWDHSVGAIGKDRAELEGLLKAPSVDLITPFPWGEGQNLLREVLLVADHTAYHLGELVLLRRVLGAWNK